MTRLIGTMLEESYPSLTGAALIALLTPISDNADRAAEVARKFPHRYRSKMASTTSQPDLILGIVDNYTSYELAPFIRTLRNTNFRGHLCLFAGPRIAFSTRSYLARKGAEILRYEDRFPFIRSPHRENFTELPDPVHIYNFRHFLYLDYLLKNPGKFRNVLITDVRDVFFQRNPFDSVLADAIHVAMESPSVTLGACEWNRGWIRAGFGDQAADDFADKPISCAGTTLAPAEQMVRYLKSLLAKISEMVDAMSCADQAAHNILLHEGRLDPVQALRNFQGPILTLGNEPAFRLNGDGELVNEDSSVVDVIHQYDRHPELQYMLDHRLRPSAWQRKAALAFHRLQLAVRKLTRFVTVGVG